MPIRHAEAVWEGTLRDGKGTMRSETGAVEGAYSASSRFEDGSGTNPEELIGAAHAGCFSMAFALVLEQAGHRPERIETKADVTIEKVGDGFRITGIQLRTRGRVPGIDAGTFREKAEVAKKGCPVSQALTGTEIGMEAELME